MAIDYYLELNTKNSDKDILKMILNLESFFQIEDKTGFYSDGVVGGIQIQKVDDHYAEVHQEIMQENFGFTPTLSAWFRTDSYENYEIGMKNGLKAFMTILQCDDSDAVMSMDSEFVKFTRLNGKLSLDADSFHEGENTIWSYKDVPFAEFEVKDLPRIE